MRNNYSDKRKTPTKIPNISTVSFLKSHFKEICAFIIIILLIGILVFKGEGIPEGLNSFLFSVGGAAVGFLFGNHS